MDDVEQLKLLLRENDMPFFSDIELSAYLAMNENNLNQTIHQCALIKAQNSAISVGGLTLADGSAYFRHLAARYRPSQSGVLKGGF